MSGVLLPFERFEYDTRIEKTRRAMQARGIELLIVSDPSNMAWLTGYDGWSFYVHQPTSRAIRITTCSRPSGTRWTISRTR